MKSILLFANTDWYLFNFRRSLANAIRDSGYHPLLVSPPGPYGTKLKSSGHDWFQVGLSRRSINPLSELSTLVQCLSLYRRLRPSLVHHFTIKPVLYGSISSRILGVPAVVNSLTGLGYLFISPKRSVRILRTLLRPLYRLALSGRQTRVVFQNAEHMKLLVGKGFASADSSRVIPGSGVDPLLYTPQEEPSGRPVILMPSRMLWDKGVGDLVEAARILESTGVDVRVVLAGGIDAGNPAGISPFQMEAWVAEGIVEWWGHQEDMARAYAASHIVVLPSYGEGLPRALLEAAAMAKPIVATDISGCREIVHPGKNGILVPPGNPAELANALAVLILNPDQRRSMGDYGRKLVMEKFTDSTINQQTLAIYRELLESYMPRD